MSSKQVILVTTPVTQPGLSALEDFNPILQSPLLQSMVWPVFLIIALLLFREQLASLLRVLRERIEQGDSVKLGGMELASGGKVVKKTSDLSLSEVDVVGNPDRFKLLFKVQTKIKDEAQEDFFKKSTKAMEVPGGCIVQVTSERRNPDGTWSLAEALTFVPGEIVIDDDHKSGRYLTSGKPED